MVSSFLFLLLVSLSFFSFYWFLCLPFRFGYLLFFSSLFCLDCGAANILLFIHMNIYSYVLKS